jgi:ABC-type amino acid transport substrate-binding protein
VKQNIVLFIIAGFACAACLAPSQATENVPDDKLAEIRARGTLFIATDADYMPQSKFFTSKLPDPDANGIQLAAVITILPNALAAIQAGRPAKLMDKPVAFEYIRVTLDRSSRRDPTRLLEEITTAIQQMHRTRLLKKLSIQYQGLDLTQEAAEFDMTSLEQIP